MRCKMISILDVLESYCGISSRSNRVSCFRVDLSIQRVPKVFERGIATEAIDPFFVGIRHHQIRVAPQTVDYGISPAVTVAFKIEGGGHGGDCHRPGSTRQPGHDRRYAATCTATEASKQNDHDCGDTRERLSMISTGPNRDMKLKDTATAHMTAIEADPARVTKYFQAPIDPARR